jgi:hypothetical protein
VRVVEIEPMERMSMRTPTSATRKPITPTGVVFEINPPKMMAIPIKLKPTPRRIRGREAVIVVAAKRD